MTTPLSPLMALLTSALGWLLWSVVVGALANRLPAAWLARSRVLWQRPWPETLQSYERHWAIRRWKPWPAARAPALDAAA